MQLYDTARRAVVPFEPDELVTMYTCGITPYDATHIGRGGLRHLRRASAPARDRGHHTHCVRNVTDVDDDILAKARELGVHYLDLAAAETARFQADMGALDVLPCWSEPRATSAIADIRGFIGMVLDRGHAYEAGEAVYFDVGSFDRFGQVGQLSQARCWNWRPSGAATPTTPTSEIPSTSSSGNRRATTSLHGSRCGAPVAGWHIECSALALRELGTTIDLHGGGTDLIFPHHECETAQSETATGEQFVRHWMHHAMVKMDGRKMSKSLGNLVFVSELLKEWDARSIRLVLVRHHYRHSWEWDDGLLEDADQRLKAWTAVGE